jgi:chromosomal replication initiation ATPase DnaA
VRALRRGREKWTYDERILGSSDFVRSILDEGEKKEVKADFPKMVPSGSIHSLIEAVASRLGLSRAEVTGGSRRRQVVEARNLISHVAVRGFGMSLIEVSTSLRVSKQGILRGVEIGEQVLQEKGWEIGDLNT